MDLAEAPQRPQLLNPVLPFVQGFPQYRLAAKRWILDPMTTATVETILAALRVLSRHYDNGIPAGDDVALLRSCVVNQAEANLPIDELACLLVERARKKVREEKSHLSAVAEADKLTFRSGTQI